MLLIVHRVVHRVVHAGVLQNLLISPLLEDPLETVEHKHKVRREHLHQTRLLRRSLEHKLEAHLLFVDLPVLDLAPTELDHLVLK